MATKKTGYKAAARSEHKRYRSESSSYATAQAHRLIRGFWREDDPSVVLGGEVARAPFLDARLNARRALAYFKRFALSRSLQICVIFIETCSTNSSR
jgi:hypothetical protein